MYLEKREGITYHFNLFFLISKTETYETKQNKKQKQKRSICWSI